MEAILKALARPPQTIAKIIAVRREVERNYSSLNRSSRWPLGLLDDTRQRLNEEREEKARRSEEEAELLCRELRYTQQTVAGELAGWRDMHEKMGRRAIRDLARGMICLEKMRLEGVKRALRRVRDVEVNMQSEDSGRHVSVVDGGYDDTSSSDHANSSSRSRSSSTNGDMGENDVCGGGVVGDGDLSSSGSTTGNLDNDPPGERPDYNP